MATNYERIKQMSVEENKEYELKICSEYNDCSICPFGYKDMYWKCELEKKRKRGRG